MCDLPAYEQSRKYFKQSGSGFSGLEVYGEASGCGAPENTLSRSCFPGSQEICSPEEQRNLVFSSIYRGWIFELVEMATDGMPYLWKFSWTHWVNLSCPCN
ncbi:uncharacterized protein LOC117907463 [Vitis riparia]|uniref:uncharacterized protein LOC117907463 n=1 Tax=Vitis riparia TaxID=96939 RepID=UPI00155B29F4|nr:uncharacterized protein LOC117907463 [Vitis riparia]